MMVLVCVVTLLGLNGLIEVIGKMGPAIAIIAIFLACTPSSPTPAA